MERRTPDLSRTAPRRRSLAALGPPLALLALAALLTQPAAAAPPMVRVALAEGATTLALGSTSGLMLQDAQGRLLWRTTGAARLTVRRGGFFIELADPEAVIYLGPYATAAEARVQRQQLGLLLDRELPLVRHDVVVEGEGRIGLPASALPLRLVVPHGFPTYRGLGYRGTLTISGGVSGLLLVNEVDLESYLSSVVGAEMPPSWPGEALRAQAVAARTYLLARQPQNGSAQYDICATERCQVYHGLGSEAASTRQAVSDTAGQVLVYNGQLIQALYSSNSGGMTESVEYVFGGSAPYLRSVASPGDAAASVYQWTQTFSAADVQRALRADDLGALLGISVPTRSPSGRAVSLRLEGSYGSRDVPAVQARALLGLRSTLFWPTFRPTEIAAIAADDTAGRQAIRRAGGQRLGVLGVEQPRSAAEARALGALWLYAIPARLEIEGRGWGHGVGMSQWGARGMALAGADYRAILAHYYPGTTLVGNYGR